MFIKWTQEEFRVQAEFQKPKTRLNLQLNRDGIPECHGSMQGDIQVIEDTYIHTLHGRISITMTHIRKYHWIPKLRQLTKKVIRRYYGSSLFQVMRAREPTPGLLPKDRTEGQQPFQVVGTDYTEPLI